MSTNYSDFYRESLQPTPSDKLETVDDLRQYMDGHNEVSGEVSTGAILVAIALLLEKLQQINQGVVDAIKMLDRHNEVPGKEYK